VSHRRITLTSTQPLGSRSLVLSHRHVQLSRSLSHCISQENHLDSGVSHHLNSLHRGDQYIVSSPSQREQHTQLMGFLTQQGHTTFHLRLREEPHTQLMGFLTPRGHTTFHLHLKEESHTQLMGFLTPHKGTTFHLHLREEPHAHLMGTPNLGSLSSRLTQSVSWRMSHAAVIINMFFLLQIWYLHVSQHLRIIKHTYLTFHPHKPHSCDYLSTLLPCP
jgi:hypothetical protein